MPLLRLLSKLDFDFTNVCTGPGFTYAVRQAVPVNAFAGGVLRVLFHEGSIPLGGSLRIDLRAVAPTKDDPAVFFQGPCVGTVQLTSLDIAPALLENAAAIPTGYVGVFLTATQALTHGTLVAKITVELDAQEGEPPSTGLSLSTGGAFSRPTEAAYRTGAPTDGAKPFLAWAGADVRRVEDRGDGLGPMLLVEGTRTNLVYPSRDPQPSATWSAGTGTMTYDQGTGPDGSPVAARGQVTTVQEGSYAAFALVKGIRYSGSAWGIRRATSGIGYGQMAMSDGVVAPASSSLVPLTETAWTKLDYGGTSGATGTGSHFPWEGTSKGGGTAADLDFLADLHQVEAGGFPSSPIRTTTGPATRDADRLYYAASDYPTTFLDRGFRIVVVPDFSSAELLVSADDACLVSFDPGLTRGAVLLGQAGTLRVLIPGVGLTTTHSGVTYARGQALTVEVCPAAGIVSLSGASAGSGTTVIAAWAFVAGTLHVGTLDGGATSPFFGRIAATLVRL